MAKAGAGALSLSSHIERRLSSVYTVILLFAAFALSHAGVARLAGPTLALDDAKLNVVTQSFQRGYLPANPPLFEWLLILAQHLAGPGALSFALVKAAFFAAAGAFTCLAARSLLESRRWGALCAFSLLLLFQFGWNYHQAFTHTTALIAATAFFWFALARIVRLKTFGGYVLLGLALGIGMMAKYSFAAAAAAALAALALQREGRRVLADPLILLSLALAFVVFAPHASWIAANNADLADAMTARLTSGGAEPHFQRAANGVPSALGVMLAFFLPLGFVAAALLWPRFSLLAKAPASGARLARDGALIGAAGLVAAVLLVGMDRMEDRYVIPFLYPAVFVIASALKASPGSDANAKILAVCAASFALFCLGFKLVTVLRPGPPFCNDCRQFIAFAPLQDGLVARGFGGTGTLVGFDETTAGNLRRLFPRARVLAWHLPAYAPPEASAGAPCFFVWSLDLGAPPPETLLAGIGKAQAAAVESLTRPLAGERRLMTWTVAAVEPDGPIYDQTCARPRSPQ